MFRILLYVCSICEAYSLGIPSLFVSEDKYVPETPEGDTFGDAAYNIFKEYVETSSKGKDVTDTTTNDNSNSFLPDLSLWNYQKERQIPVIKERSNKSAKHNNTIATTKDITSNNDNGKHDNDIEKASTSSFREYVDRFINKSGSSGVPKIDDSKVDKPHLSNADRHPLPAVPGNSNPTSDNSSKEDNTRSVSSKYLRPDPRLVPHVIYDMACYPGPIFHTCVQHCMKDKGSDTSSKSASNLRACVDTCRDAYLLEPTSGCLLSDGSIRLSSDPDLYSRESAAFRAWKYRIMSDNTMHKVLGTIVFLCFWSVVGYYSVKHNLMDTVVKLIEETKESQHPILSIVESTVEFISEKSFILFNEILDFYNYLSSNEQPENDLLMSNLVVDVDDVEYQTLSTLPPLPGIDSGHSRTSARIG